MITVEIGGRTFRIGAWYKNTDGNRTGAVSRRLDSVDRFGWPVTTAAYSLPIADAKTTQQKISPTLWLDQAGIEVQP